MGGKIRVHAHFGLVFTRPLAHNKNKLCRKGAIPIAILIKRALPEDLPECCRVEQASNIGLAYVADVFDHFTRYTVGDFSCGYIDGQLAGIGKLTRLYDGSAWLETLRVDARYQGRGLGKAFYNRFSQQAVELGCPVMRMYTGASNVVSAGLARLNGLEVVAQHQGMTLDLPTAHLPGLPEGFYMATPREAMAAYAGQESGFICLNRTFYAHNPDTIAGLAGDGRVFIHPETGSALVLGARFQRFKGLHLAAPIGDIERCLRFAVAYTAAEGLPRLTCTFATDNTYLPGLLTDMGFVPEPAPTVVMEGPPAAT
jgi:ribosomal protein S18 acetylase RimI-like enzyme